MMCILHLSDTHFGTEQAPVLEALVRFVQAHAPQLAILSGDITQRARPREFQAAAHFLQRLRVPAVLAIPGNHDISLFQPFARLFQPYARYGRAFGPVLEPVYETPALLAIGVKTTRRYRHVEGEVSAKQVEQVAQRLRQASARQLRLVVTHQPLHVIHTEDEKNRLRGHALAAHRWAVAGADLILGGHIHRPFVAALPPQAGAAKKVWVVQAGTALSARVRHDAGNSLNLIRYPLTGPGRRCQVERWDYDPTADNFVLVAQQALDCG